MASPVGFEVHVTWKCLAGAKEPDFASSAWNCSASKIFDNTPASVGGKKQLESWIFAFEAEVGALGWTEALLRAQESEAAVTHG
eukprot:1264078-Amphidinium_carterae.1